MAYDKKAARHFNVVVKSGKVISICLMTVVDSISNKPLLVSKARAPAGGGPMRSHFSYLNASKFGAQVISREQPPMPTTHFLPTPDLYFASLADLDAYQAKKLSDRPSANRMTKWTPRKTAALGSRGRLLVSRGAKHDVRHTD